MPIKKNKKRNIPTRKLVKIVQAKNKKKLITWLEIESLKVKSELVRKFIGSARVHKWSTNWNDLIPVVAKCNAHGDRMLKRVGNELGAMLNIKNKQLRLLLSLKQGVDAGNPFITFLGVVEYIRSFNKK